MPQQLQNLKPQSNSVRHRQTAHKAQTTSQRGNVVTWHISNKSAFNPSDERTKQEKNEKGRKAVKMKIHLRNIYTKPPRQK